ncbi:kynurenine--oxoglutarate transaminase 3-like [Bos indicus]|uniref:Kynurenine--oxoglutarate transaminase 3 n=1 Tax=Bos indicus TaxID=9915 RepID=A0A6P5CBJ3_BOSIN|nr:kynurenine--oxoglutarate transaminase 3-like [Bos indicus x Bos taurus]
MVLPLQLRVSKEEVLLFGSTSQSPRIGGREEGSFVGPVDQPAEGFGDTSRVSILNEEAFPAPMFQDSQFRRADRARSKIYGAQGYLEFTVHGHLEMLGLRSLCSWTFSVASGFKLGWSIGPKHLIKHLQTVQQNTVYTCATPLQEALAQAFWIDIKRMDDPECYFNSLPKELEVKRDRMVHLLESVGLKPIVPDGGYFIIADVSLLDVDLFDMKDSNETYDYKFVKWMIKNKKLSAIPVSAFCNAETKLQFEKFVRFCFIKKDSTLDAAEEIIKAWSRQNS